MRYTPLATEALCPMPYALCPMPGRAPHVTEKGYRWLVKPAPTIIWAYTIAYFRVTKTQSSAVFTISAFCKPKCFKTGFSNRK